MNPATANTFMNSRSFKVLDYKLKTLSTGPYAGTPMGQFLLEDPRNPGFAVCAHIGFETGKTDSVERINLVHYRDVPMGSKPYVEDHDGMSEARHTIDVSSDPNASFLIQACRDYVQRNEPGRWEDVSRWNMKGGELGFNGKFR